jgi:anthranilate phosphoribosyltransferase
MIDETKLRAFGAFIVRLQKREGLSREETREAYGQIWRNEQPELQQGAFIAALRCKGETPEEMLGVAEAYDEMWHSYFPDTVKAPEPHLGIVGVGMDSLKTVNVSSGAAIVAAACGVYVYKIAAPGMTGISGSAETFAMMGMDPDVEPSAAFRATEKSRLGYTSVVGAAQHRTGNFRVLGQMRCGTSVHIGGPMAFHSGERHKIIGVPDPAMCRMVCEGMKHLGYRRALVPCGGSREHPGRYLDEYSNLGATHVAELHEDGTITEYDVNPEDAGLVAAHYEDVAAAKTPEQNVRIVARVIANRQHGPVADLIALNAASCLLIMGKESDLKSGVIRAREAIQSGAALRQIQDAIRAQNPDPAAGLSRLEAFLAG